MTEKNKKYWYAFYTKPRAEFKAEIEIDEVGIEIFLPSITVVKQWADRKKKVVEPLFKSYIFAYVNEKERFQVLNSKSIVSCVNFSGKPARIPDVVIEDLKTVLHTKEKLLVSNRLEIGTRVKIIDGSFAGVTGVVFKNELDENLFAITIELLNRSVVVRLPQESVIKEII